MVITYLKTMRNEPTGSASGATRTTPIVQFGAGSLPTHVDAVPTFSMLRTFMETVHPAAICNQPFLRSVADTGSILFFVGLVEHSPIHYLVRRKKWGNSEYRHAYMESAIEQGVAWQIRINRERRGLSQSDLARLIGSKQSAISRVEDESYGRHRLETLVKIANAFDCVLQVRFVPYSKLARDSEDLSPTALYARSYVEEIQNVPDSPRAIRHSE